MTTTISIGDEVYFELTSHHLLVNEIYAGIVVKKFEYDTVKGSWFNVYSSKHINTLVFHESELRPTGRRVTAVVQ